MVYTFNKAQKRKLKGYFQKARQEGEPGYDREQVASMPIERAFCEYWVGVFHGYFTDAAFQKRFGPPTKVNWFANEILKYGPSGVSLEKVQSYVAEIDQLTKSSEAQGSRKALPSLPHPTIEEKISKPPKRQEKRHSAPATNKMKLISMKIEPELYELAKEAAKADGRTFGNLVRHLLTKHLNENSA